MTLPQTVVSFTLKSITRLLCDIEDEHLEKVPARGPLILVVNHVNFLDAPLVYSHLQPRPLTGFAKIETWENFLIGSLFSLFEAIPIQRGEVDMTAIRMGLSALQQGKILAIAPEGTRSGHGRLQRGHPGVVTLAMKSGAPVLPMVFYGGENFRSNISRLRRTPFTIRTGSPFEVRSESGSITHQSRQKAADEIMYQLADLLPPSHRGVYSDMSVATTDFLHFLN